MVKLLNLRIKNLKDNKLAHAENLGVAAKLYEKHTASYFTEAFGNVMYNGTKSESKYQKLNSLMFEQMS